MHLDLAAGLSANTRRAYRVGQRLWLQSCAGFGWEPLMRRERCAPLEAERRVMVFAVQQAERVGAGTVGSYLAAVRALHVEHVGEVLWDGGVRLPQLLAGIRRRLLRPGRRRAPVTLDLLRLWRGLLDLSQPYHRSLWAAVLLAFFGLLRKSEFTVAAAGRFDPDFHLSRGQVRFTRERSGAITSMDVYVRFSKTAQFGTNVAVPVARVGGLLCPVEAMLQHLGGQECPAWQASWPLFSGGGVGAPASLPLTGPLFAAELRSLVSRTPALAGTVLSPHSLRIGGAMALFQAGAPDTLIQMVGRWRGLSFADYLRFDRAVVLRWNHRMAAEPDEGLGLSLGGGRHAAPRRRGALPRRRRATHRGVGRGL